jgi:hypothetical protein
MTDNSDPIPPAVADQDNIGFEPHRAAKPPAEEVRVGGEEEGVILAATGTAFERIVRIAKDIVQTVGIIAAGIFAIYKFSSIDEPTLQRHFAVSGSLSWVKRSTFCIANLDIELKNMSKSRIEVTKIRGTSWLIDEPSGTPDHFVHFDPRNIILDKKPSNTFSYTNGPLAQSYVPDEAAQHSFEWLVPREPKGIAVFSIESFGGPNESPILLNSNTQWDVVCGEGGEGNTKSSK